MLRRRRWEIFSVEANCFACKPERTLNRCRKVCRSVSRLGSILPRRFISSSIAASNKSNSPSLKCLTALPRSLGRICRCGAVSLVGFAAPGFGGGGEESRIASVEKRSGEVLSRGSRAMVGLWRYELRGPTHSAAPKSTRAGQCNQSVRPEISSYLNAHGDAFKIGAISYLLADNAGVITVVGSSDRGRS